MTPYERWLAHVAQNSEASHKLLDDFDSHAKGCKSAVVLSAAMAVAAAAASEANFSTEEFVRLAVKFYRKSEQGQREAPAPKGLLS